MKLTGNGWMDHTCLLRIIAHRLIFNTPFFFLLLLLLLLLLLPLHISLHPPSLFSAFEEAGHSLTAAEVRAKLTLWSRALLESLPDFMQYSLCLSRGSDKQLQVSQTETERLLAHFVDIELGRQSNLPHMSHW